MLSWGRKIRAVVGVWRERCRFCLQGRKESHCIAGSDGDVGGRASI